MSHDVDHNDGRNYNNGCDHYNGRDHDHNRARDRVNTRDGLVTECAVNRVGDDHMGSEGRSVDRGQRRWLGGRHGDRYLYRVSRRSRSTRGLGRHGLLPQGEVRYCTILLFLLYIFLLYLFYYCILYIHTMSVACICKARTFVF